MNARRHILFVSYDGMTDPLGQSQVLPYLLGLEKAGYRFTILSCEKLHRFLAGKEDVRSIITGLDITWVPLKYHKYPPVLSAIYDVQRLKTKALAIHKRDPFDMVHTRAGLPALVGLWLKKKTGIKFLHDIREFYADGRVDGGLWDLNKFHYKKVYQYFKKKESEELKGCDGVVCLTNAAARILSATPELKKSVPLAVIPCSVDLDLFDPESISEQSREELRQQLAINPGDFVLAYLGSLGTWYMIDEMVQLVKEITSLKVNTRFLFITPHERSEIESVCQKNGLDTSAVITVKAKRKEVPAYLRIADFCIFFIRPCFSKLSSSPTKHGEIMAMGLPLITNTGVGDVESIVTSTNSGIVLNDFSQEALKNVAQKVIGEVQREGFTTPDIHIRESAKGCYSLKKAVQLYLDLYKRVLQ